MSIYRRMIRALLRKCGLAAWVHKGTSCIKKEKARNDCLLAAHVKAMMAWQGWFLLHFLNAPLYLHFLTTFYYIYPWLAMIRKRVSIHIQDIFIFESQLPFLDEVLDLSLQHRAIFHRVSPIARMIITVDILVIPSGVWWLQ